MMYMYNSFTSGGAVGKVGIKNVHVCDAIWVTLFFFYYDLIFF